uniref:Uncharacterized protein n=1 Tax=Knipowitschia caucasica TaxID=637954 RepID=A0AAV2J539_KNICA
MKQNSLGVTRHFACFCGSSEADAQINNNDTEPDRPVVRVSCPIVPQDTATHAGITMTTKMVVQQPQPVMVSMTSNEWSSGICDCFHDVPQCHIHVLIHP